MRIRIYVFNLKTNEKKIVTRRQKAKRSKDKKGISVENLTGYDGIVCEFDLDRVVNFSWLFI